MVFYVRPGQIGEPPYVDEMFNLPEGYREVIAGLMAREKLTGRSPHKTPSLLAEFNRFLFVSDIRARQNPERIGPLMLRSSVELDRDTLDRVLANRFHQSPAKLRIFLDEAYLYAVPKPLRVHPARAK